MNLEQIEYIKEISQTKSITKAAENLGISQSAISQSISSLEQELGIRLFKRSRYGTFPTDEGKSTIQKALDVLHAIDDIKEDARITSKFLTGDLRLAADTTLIHKLPKVIGRFKQQYPHVNITVLETTHEQILKTVDDFTFHIGITGVSDDVLTAFPSNMQFHQFGQVPIAELIVPKNSPLLSKPHPLTIHDIVTWPMIFHKTPYWEKFITFYEKQYGPLNVLLMTSNTAVIKSMVAEGIGISILPNYLLEDDIFIDQACIYRVPIALEYGPSYKQYGYIYSTKHPQATIIQAFLPFCD